MKTEADLVIDHLGGTSAVAVLIKTSPSTVHSWRKNGIPESRLDHMRLASKETDKPLPDDLEELRAAESEA